MATARQIEELIQKAQMVRQLQLPDGSDGWRDNRMLCRLLFDSGLSVQEICNRVGYKYEMVRRYYRFWKADPDSLSRTPDDPRPRLTALERTLSQPPFAPPPQYSPPEGPLSQKGPPSQAVIDRVGQQQREIRESGRTVDLEDAMPGVRPGMIDDINRIRELMLDGVAHLMPDVLARAQEFMAPGAEPNPAQVRFVIFMLERLLPSADSREIARGNSNAMTRYNEVIASVQAPLDEQELRMREDVQDRLVAQRQQFVVTPPDRFEEHGNDHNGNGNGHNGNGKHV